MKSLVVVDRRLELGRRQHVVVEPPDEIDRTSRAGMVLGLAAAQLLGYLAGEIPSICVQSGLLVADSSCGLR
jgi:hypothetical protein